MSDIIHDVSLIPRFLRAGEHLISVNDIALIRRLGGGRTTLVGGFGNVVIDMDFDVICVQLAKFAIIHELDLEAKP